VVSCPRISHTRRSDLRMFDVTCTIIRRAVQREAVEIAKNGGGGGAVTPKMTCNCDLIRSSLASDCEESCGLGCSGVAFHVNVWMFRMNILPPCSGPQLPFHRILHAAVIYIYACLMRYIQIRLVEVLMLFHERLLYPAAFCQPLFIVQTLPPPPSTCNTTFQKVLCKSVLGIHTLVCVCACACIYTGCNRRNGPDFGRVFLMLKYTDITQNTYVQS
jgi:hypothetical protein